MTIDPHTADGVRVAREHMEQGVPMLVLETAKPRKFAGTIAEALGVSPETDTETHTLLNAPQRITQIPNNEQQLRDLITKFALH